MQLVSEVSFSRPCHWLASFVFLHHDPDKARMPLGRWPGLPRIALFGVVFMLLTACSAALLKLNCQSRHPLPPTSYFTRCNKWGDEFLREPDEPLLLPTSKPFLWAGCKPLGWEVGMFVTKLQHDTVIPRGRQTNQDSHKQCTSTHATVLGTALIIHKLDKQSGVPSNKHHINGSSNIDLTHRIKRSGFRRRAGEPSPDSRGCTRKCVFRGLEQIVLERKLWDNFPLLSRIEQSV